MKFLPPDLILGKFSKKIYLKNGYIYNDEKSKKTRLCFYFSIP